MKKFGLVINPSKTNFLGIGIDVVHIPTFERSLENSPGLYLRIFSNSEMSRDVTSLAGNFAVKEAAIKSLGQAGMPVDFRNIFVGRNDSGIPFIEVNAQNFLEGKSGRLSFSTSISHHADYAIAIVVCFEEKTSRLSAIKNLLVRTLFR